MDVVVESDRDRRTLDWLINEVGVVAVENACCQLAGQRKLYVSNIAKALGLTPPDIVFRPTRDEARARLAAIKKTLQGTSRS
jgi:hypothetical protein